ncbi:MAG TPA: YbhB/YbcL family Raf kinase inhibitor-like protein [Thermoanaerobaculia bacterium]|nr:YbhB/YbcL family Raf kinase inhibitor-like protein [Thermoanaerobaculia bacterium]
MTNRILLAIALAVPLRCAAEPETGGGTARPAGGGPAPAKLDVTSAAFKHMELIPAEHTCDGGDRLVPLQIANIPPAAKSLAIIVDDPDVPKTLRPDGNWDHWLIWNLPPATSSIAHGGIPTSAVQGKNSWGRNDWGGPCPPDREHRYFFKVFALDTMLDLAPSSGKQALEKAMEGHVLAKGEIVGRYDRKR